MLQYNFARNRGGGWSDVLTTGSSGIARAGDFSPKFLDVTGGAILNRHPRIKEIISGIILLGARGKDPIPLDEVHSIIHAMKFHESILSGLRFTLTGAVCYSRDIDQAIQQLTDGRFLKIIEGSAFVGENAHDFGKYLNGFLTNSQIRAVHSVSLRFHDRLRRDVRIPVAVHDRSS